MSLSSGLFQDFKCKLTARRAMNEKSSTTKDIMKGSLTLDFDSDNPP
jgi:hypothetical protein